MKPLLSVVSLCLLLCVHALPENIEDVKELPQSKEPIVEAEESKPQARAERCTTCSTLKLGLKSPKEVLAALHSLPGAEVHTQQSFEGCSSDKGCAGLKLKDGKVIERFGNVEAFKAAAASDVNNEFNFHAGFGSDLFKSANSPFWWMNQDSPFNGGANGASFEKFSKSSSFSSGSGGNAAFTGMDLSANPFLNGQFSNLGLAGDASSVNPFQSSTFESSAFSASSKTGQAGLQGFGAQNAASNFGASAFNSGFAGNKLSGFSGSSPAPFGSGANVNLIQNAQKNDFDFEQQQTQQNIDEIFQNAGNLGVDAGVTAGELQQTCSGLGYACVLKTQCNNGVVNINGAAALQAKTKKQYCNLATEICCRIETAQGAVGSTAGQGSGLFAGQIGSVSGGYGSQTTQSGFSNGFGAKGTFATGASFGSGIGSANRGITVESTKFGSGYGSTLAPTTSRFGSNGFKSTSQTNFIDADSLTAGSEAAGVYRPGAVGSGLKPGIPYLPPIDVTGSGSNVVSTTVFPTPTIITTPRPFTTPKPTYLPPISSTSAPGYLPPIGEPTNNRETIVPKPDYQDGSIILDENRFPTARPTPVPAPSEIPAGCAAALKCTAVEFCTAEGVISNVTVFLTRDQEAYRVPLTDCRDLETGRIGKCCRDPYYTDPWPVNQLGKWVPGVFGGNDGKYVPDSRVSPNNIRPSVTVRPPVTGSVISPAFLTKPTPTPFGPNQVSPGFGSTVTPLNQRGQGQFPIGGQGQYNKGGLGQFSQGGQGQFTSAGQGQLGIIGQGQIGSGSAINTAFAQGQVAQKGQGSFVSQGQGVVASRGQGQVVNRGQVSKGQGFLVNQGAGVGINKQQGQFVSQGQGQIVSQGQGQIVSQGVGQGVRQGVGQYGQGQLGIQGQGVQSQFGAGQNGLGVAAIGAQGVNGQGQLVNQGQGQFVSKGQGSAINQGFGTGIRQGSGVVASQGFGQGVRQGQGTVVSQGFGQGVRQGQGLLVNQGEGQVSSQGQGQFVSQGQGQLLNQGQGQYVSQGEGQLVSQGQGALVSQGQGQLVSQGQGAFVSQGQGSLVSQGFGQAIRPGQGAFLTNGQGQIVSQGGGALINQGEGAYVTNGFDQIRRAQAQLVSTKEGQLVTQGEGELVSQGQGQRVSQGFGQGVRQGQGFSVTQGGGYGVENEYGESVQRVFLQQYNAGGQCGVLNGQRPFGNRNELEADFAEIPWQAMVLLQTNRSLLCGGVITRPDVVVTSAACVEGLDAKNVLIKGGEWKLGIDDEPLPFQIVQVKTILRHPLYKHSNLHYDAAILVLAENLRFAKNIYPICLPDKDDSLDKYYNGVGECIVTGWGKQVLQAHLQGSIMHSINVSLISPGECQSKLSSEYPHLLDLYDEDSCVCGQPSNPLNNICRVDIGSALACTTGDGHYTFRGVYSWDSGCQVGNQVAGFYRFDLEWYQWAIGLIESVRFAQYSTVTKVTTGIYTGQIKGGVKGFSGVKGVKGSSNSGSSIRAGAVASVSSGAVSSGSSGVISGLNSFNFGKGQFGFGQSQGQLSGNQGLVSQGQFAGKVNQFQEKINSGSSSQAGFGDGFNFSEIKPITNGFSATFSEKKVFKTEPKFVTFTTKPEIVTYTTKPEIFTFTTKPKIITYTTKPKIITYTTKPQIIRYETSGSGTNPQYVAPGVTFNPSFSELVGKHEHTAKCKCLEGK
ncbi:Serine protease H164 [Danaus plexippus plexippus]|uniref:Serine protease H164 n=1 Tax=Danaus plexippus plexippus TaxID=278856 RepID=A0A212EQZ0_DANPL|nr:uncharacterized protein LOC116776575 [Danaus plexippus plexippus]OWR43864.1 Serine protease H164 [Danaus plexippus plexippus]